MLVTSIHAYYAHRHTQTHTMTLFLPLTHMHEYTHTYHMHTCAYTSTNRHLAHATIAGVHSALNTAAAIPTVLRAAVRRHVGHLYICTHTDTDTDIDTDTDTDTDT